MSAMLKVLVVDDGDRDTDPSVVLDLAELGLASITASFEAAEQVLDMVEPAAILVQLPDRCEGTRFDAFVALAQRLEKGNPSRVPVILCDRRTGAPVGGHTAWRETLGAHAVSLPDL